MMTSLPDLPDGPTGLIANDIISYTSSRSSEWKKCKKVTLLKLTKIIIISLSHGSKSYKRIDKRENTNFIHETVRRPFLTTSACYDGPVFLDCAP